jgi:hypothetical protein
MQSPQDRSPEQPSPGYGQQPSYGQPPAYGQTPYNQNPQPGYGSYASAPIPSAIGGYEAPRVGGVRVLKKINPGSAFRVGAITYAILWAILGLPIIFIMSAAGAASGNSGNGAGALMAGAGLFGYILGIVGYGLMGGIGGAVGAFVYNLVSGWVGGLEIEVS